MAKRRKYSHGAWNYEVLSLRVNGTRNYGKGTGSSKKISRTSFSREDAH